MKKSINLITALAAMAIALIPAANAAQILTNGGFESGFTGWSRDDALGGDGTFFIQIGTLSPVNLDPVPAPAGGTNAAMSDGAGPGSHVLWQDFMIPGIAGQVLLSFDLYVGNRAGLYATPSPGSLDFGLNAANQQVRVDILAGTAGNFSVDSGDVLQTVYQTNAGDALISGYTTVTLDITVLANANVSNTLRLRFAETDNLAQLQAGIDNVSIDVQAVPEPSALLLMAVGLCGAVGLRRYRRA